MTRLQVNSHGVNRAKFCCFSRFQETLARDEFIKQIMDGDEDLEDLQVPPDPMRSPREGDGAASSGLCQ